jgi:hypothetical protein
MTTPLIEDEVLRAELERLGCPYDASNLPSLTKAWVSGYKKGFNDATDGGIKALHDLLNP